MSERRHNIDPPPKVLVKVVHGCTVDMSANRNGEAVRHGGELIRVSQRRAEGMIRAGLAERV